jgi:DNA invertase Pin-like site-specific DNA recombinase
VRVSTDSKKVDLQLAALEKAGCRHIFTDTASKRPNKNRQTFETAKGLIIQAVRPVAKFILFATGGASV